MTISSADSMSADELTTTFLAARTSLLAREDIASGERRRGLTELTDRWIHGLFVLSGAASIGASLIAVGGYGRGELAPGSDIDLVLLHPAAAPTARVNEVADALWYPIWDSGIKLDHAVRVPAEMRRLAAAELKVVLGFLDARTVSGDEALTKSVRESILGDWRALAPRRLSELHENVTERAARAGELAYLLEPNLKDSHGGLRDIVALRAVAASWITDAPLAGLVPHRELLLDARDALHLSTGRATDVVVAQDRVDVARRLGMHGEDPSDELLRSLSSAGRAIAYASDVTWHRVQRLQRRSTGRLFNRTRRIGSQQNDRAPLADGVVVQDGEVVLAVDVQPGLDSVLILRVAAAAAQAGLRIAPHAVERLALTSAPLPVPWPAEARDSLVSLLGAGSAAVPVWEALDQQDMWSRLIPEWSAVRSAPQHNPVHSYTVDRHLVEAAVQAVPFTRRVDRPDLLLIGALLHDIGKARPGDHTEVGVRLVDGIAPQLGFDQADSQVLRRMVEFHLLLPDTATRRDLDDPATVSAVADAVGDERLLDLLHALTEADAAATGPAAWSDWKKVLVDELVSRTRTELRRRQVIDTTPSPVGDIGVGLVVKSALVRTVDRQRISEDVESDAVVVYADHDEHVSVITVIAPDRTGLLSTVAGVLSLHRLAVRGAQVETVRSLGGELRAVQVWTVLPVFGQAPPVSRLREDVSRAVAGSFDVNERLAARERTYPAPTGTADPRVDIVTGASERATVLEVRAHDAPALLYRVTSAIAEAGASITAARVATLGSEVVDVFYIVDAAGEPLNDFEGDAVIGAVRDVLSDPVPQF
ncbi:MAG: [protein-PII] uridylyltransferase [Actinomycetes bacterium]